MLSEEERKELTALGKSVEEIEKQLDNLKCGFPKMNILSPATVGNGIVSLSDEEKKRVVKRYENAEIDVVKFVPASGAASRMFKGLMEGIVSNDLSGDIAKLSEAITSFPFGNHVDQDMSPLDLAKYVVSEDGLNYAQLPKGLIPFHAYEDGVRTPFEEQLYEASLYGVKNGIAKVHFTIPLAHQRAIGEVNEVACKGFEQSNKISIPVEYSEQLAKTDTVAVDREGSLVRKNGKILFRPAGHGALIENLNQIDSDLIFVKNIDNVVSASLVEDTVMYKKALAGIVLETKDEIHRLLDHLLHEPSSEVLNSAVDFVKNRLGVDLQLDLSQEESAKQFLYSYLNRPIRIAGMVVNTGEPGGGPYWVEDKNYGKSLQIVEAIQIDKEDSKQLEILNQSTHFNPVDLVCWIKDHKGGKFDLRQYVDERAGLIAEKSLEGKDIKVLELPGLWNGAMSNWITLFVEVPESTFNPVKTVFDLLKSPHQAG